LLQTRSSEAACLFVAVLREVVVVVGVVDSDNFIGQVLSKPARITIHADITTADAESIARRVGPTFARVMFGPEPGTKLGPNTAKPRHGVAAKSIIGYSMAKSKLDRCKLSNKIFFSDIDKRSVDLRTLTESNQKASRAAATWFLSAIPARLAWACLEPASR
jgi:hypothetical protein